MNIEKRRLARIYHFSAEWIDKDFFKLVVAGSTTGKRDMQFEAVVPFHYLPYFFRELMKHWLAAKKRRLDQIQQIDNSLPPPPES